jgi:MarR family 2-MHQ and catechol resistance regulon transcriptional repressor
MIDSYFLIYLHRIVNTIDRKTIAICNKYDLTLSQFGVMEALRHKGDLTVGQVKDAILSSDGTIPVVVKNLEKLGYINRSGDPKDKRRSILSLTDSGKALIDEVYPENMEMIHKELSVWSEEEKKQMTSLFQKFDYRRQIKKE